MFVGSLFLLLEWYYNSLHYAILYFIFNQSAFFPVRRVVPSVVLAIKIKVFPVQVLWIRIDAPTTMLAALGLFTDFN